MRYFNLTQSHSISQFETSEGKIDIDKLAKVAKELTEKDANHRASWGSGNYSVDEDGTWKLINADFDSSG